MSRYETLGQLRKQMHKTVFVVEDESQGFWAYVQPITNIRISLTAPNGASYAFSSEYEYACFLEYPGRFVCDRIPPEFRGCIVYDDAPLGSNAKRIDTEGLSSAWCNGETFRWWRRNASKNDIKSLYEESLLWVANRFQDGDKIVAYISLDGFRKSKGLIHCCLYRDDVYLDVRGATAEEERVLQGFEDTCLRNRLRKLVSKEKDSFIAALRLLEPCSDPDFR